MRQSSRNSSRPPSQDPPGTAPRKRAEAAARRQGAQLGHPGRHRPVLSVASVDGVVRHWPQCCERCEHRFSAGERAAAGEPVRHQVAELPEIAVRVNEHRLERLRWASLALCPG